MTASTPPRAAAAAAPALRPGPPHRQPLERPDGWTGSRTAGRPGSSAGGRPGGWTEAAPPGTDVLAHLRELLRWAPLALAAALLVALVVGLVRAQAEPVHRATATAVVEPGDAGDTGDPEDVARLAATYAAAADDPQVLTAASSDTGWTLDEAAEHITVALGEEPGVLDVSVLAESPAEAERVASAVAPALQSAVREQRSTAQADWVVELTEQLQQVRAQLATAPAGSADGSRLAADVDTRLQQISRIQRAQPPGLVEPAPPAAEPGRVSPQPLRDASLAFVLTALLVGELAVLLNGRAGAALSPGVARRLARRSRGTCLKVPRDPVGAAALLPLRGAAGDVLAAGAQVVVLAAPGVSRAEAASLVVRSASATPGATAVLTDLSLQQGPGGELLAVHLDEPWWRLLDASRVGMAVVVAQVGAPVRRAAEEAAAALVAVGAPVHVVLLSAAPRSTAWPDAEAPLPGPPAGPFGGPAAGR